MFKALKLNIMSEAKSNNSLKVIAGLLGVVLVGLLIYTVSLYQDKQKTAAAFLLKSPAC